LKKDNLLNKQTCLSSPSRRGRVYFKKEKGKIDAYPSISNSFIFLKTKSN